MKTKFSRAVKAEKKAELKGAPRGIACKPCTDRTMNQWATLAYLIHHPELLDDRLSEIDIKAFRRVSSKLREHICPRSPTQRDVYDELIERIPKRHVDGEKCTPAMRKSPKTMRGLSIE